jgi:hypothetical protein
VGVSRIHVNIDRLVLNGFAQLEGKVLVEALQSHLSHLIADRTARREWARSHRTPLLKLGRIPIEPGATGAGSFGKQVARAVVRGLKP